MRHQGRQKKTSAVRASAGRAARERLLVWIVCGGLAVIVWVAFGQAIDGDFVNYDDGDYVYENPNVSSGLTLSGVSWAFTHVHAANWHPLTTISHMLDCQLYGLQPWGHHLTNVFLHAAAAILLFLAIRNLTRATPTSAALPGRRPSPKQLIPSAVTDRRSSNLWPSAFVAVVFAIHPLRVESVAWISERKDVLSGVFFMLTLLAYAHYARDKRRSIGKYLTVIVLFALGLLCKPTLVTLPFILLLLDYWPLGRWQASSRDQKSAVRSQWSAVRRLVVEKIPLFILSATSCVITIIAQRQALEPNLNLGVLQRVNNAAVSYVIYLFQVIYPVHLTVSYPYVQIKIIEAIFAMGLLILISVIFLLVRKRYPFLITGWLWYLGMLVPMTGFVQVGLQPRADRYTYLSQIGLYLVIAGSAAVVAKKSRLSRSVVVAAGLGAVIAFIVTTRTQVTYWRDSEALWRHAIETAPTNYMAYNDLGTLLLHRHQPEAAVVELIKATQIKPDFENAYVGAGSAYMLMGRLDDAIGYYVKALQIHPDSAEDWSNLATALLKQGKNDEAIADYKKAVALKPDSADMQYNLGHALADNGKWLEAIPCYQAAIRMRPDAANFHNNLAVALIEVGKTDEALEELRAALRINPNYPDAHYNLGSILSRLGKNEEGAAHLREALRLKPDYEAARKRLNELGITR